MLIRDPERERAETRAQLANRFDLTPTETDIVLEILKGDGRKAAALRLGMAPGTARVHLQRIFDKMGVHTQAELVRVVTELGKEPISS